LLFQANDTLRRDCRNAKPRAENPSSIIAKVEGSWLIFAISSLKQKAAGCVGWSDRSQTNQK
jgi:hypothetical protein